MGLSATTNRMENTMQKHPKKPKIKRLKVVVRGFTEGFTGILWPPFEDLAERAKDSGNARYLIDFLQRTIDPTPSPPLPEDFYDFRNLPEWLEDCGSSLSFVRRFQMWVDFDLGTIEHFNSKDPSICAMRFKATTEIEAITGGVYRHHHECSVSFGYPKYIPKS